MSDLFTSADQRKRERELEREIMELRIALANMIAASRGCWHIQARKAKRNAMDLIRRAA